MNPALHSLKLPVYAASEILPGSINILGHGFDCFDPGYLKIRLKKVLLILVFILILLYNTSINTNTNIRVISMRKQLAVKILKSSFDKLKKIKEETGLSNAKIIEMLLENYDNTNINVSNNTSVTEERVAEMIQDTLANINTSTSTNINTKANVNTNVNTIKPLFTLNEEQKRYVSSLPKDHPIHEAIEKKQKGRPLTLDDEYELNNLDPVTRKEREARARIFG